MRRLAVIGLFIVFVANAGAQNTKNYTPVNMYMLNPLLANPAYSGAKESISGAVMMGANWLDIPNAQIKNWDAAGVMYSATGDFPITDKNSVGFLFVNNKFGANKNWAIYGHYAYRIITGAGKLSFGLRGGFNGYNRDLNDPSVRFRDPNDPVLNLDYRRPFPNFGAGVYWYTNTYNVGLSVPDFFFPTEGSKAFDADPKNYNYTLMGGYLFRISEDFKLKPSTMLSYSINGPLAYQGTLNFILKDMVWFGAGYKSQGIVFLLDIQPLSFLRIGYAWELPTGGVKQYAPWGSHEFLLRFDNSWELRNVSPVYFW